MLGLLCGATASSAAMLGVLAAWQGRGAGCIRRLPALLGLLLSRGRRQGPPATCPRLKALGCSRGAAGGGVEAQVSSEEAADRSVADAGSCKAGEAGLPWQSAGGAMLSLGEAVAVLAEGERR